MSRSVFGTWGIRVSRDQFSCALAALGIIGEGSKGLSSGDIAALLAERRTVGVLDWVPWFLRPTGTIEPGDALLPADLLADAWKQFVATNATIRIQILPHRIIDFLWVLSELTRPIVGAASVYLSKPGLSERTRWHWPLRVGFLSNHSSNQVTREIKDQIKTRQWTQSLIQIVDIETEDRCDLLISTVSLRSSLPLLFKRASPLQADCAIFFDTIGSNPARSMQIIESIDAELRTNAIALARPPGVEANWFVEFFRSLTHDQPFDVALTSSLRDSKYVEVPLILADGRWIEEVRLSTMTRSLIKAISDNRPTFPLRKIASADQVSHVIDHVQLKRISDLFNFERDREFFFRESGGATTLAQATNVVGPTIRRAGAARIRDDVRYLEARVSLLDGESDGVRATDVTSFKAGNPHRIDVRIGPENARWIQNKHPFPFQGLPWRRGSHRLTVVFTEPSMAAQPQVGHITLPPTGPSSECPFYLVPNGNHTVVQARISVLYKNRVLQTSILEGSVTGESDKVADQGRISFSPEVVVSPGMSDLDRQGSFGAALILNHAANEAQVTKIVNNSAELISVSNLAQWVDQIEDRLGRTDWGAKNMQRIDSAGTLDLLRFLAAHGSLLYKGIVKQQFADQALKAAKRIQLIAAKPGSRLPVEYFYELSSPREDAKLCPSAKNALSKGECPAVCPGRKDQGSYVCPLGFWGISRVLEWHVYRPSSARQLGNHDFALQEEKIASRKQLDVMRQALIGASAKADAEVKNSVATLERNITKSGVPLQPANTWKKWEDSIEKYGPSMLVLIPHTDIDSRDIQQLEIGKAQWLPLDQLDERYVGNDKVHPVVFLLGCETAKQAASFEDFISNFALYGAAIVVASSTVVLGRQATVVAAEFVSTIKRMSKLKNKTFGDVVLEVRRKMLAKGFPMVMSVSAYGDADWRI